MKIIVFEIDILENCNHLNERRLFISVSKEIFQHFFSFRELDEKIETTLYAKNKNKK